MMIDKTDERTVRQYSNLKTANWKPQQKGSTWKSKGCLGMADCYKFYVKERGKRPPVLGNMHIVYPKICSEFNELIMETVLAESFFFLFNKLGRIETQVKKITTKRKQVDWKATKELTEKADAPIYHTNDHSNNTYTKFKWVKGATPNITQFKFIPSRATKRKLSAKLLNKD